MHWEGASRSSRNPTLAKATFRGLARLVRKELHLQQNTIALGLLLTLFQFATLLLCLRFPSTARAEIDASFTFPLWLQAIFIPLVAGASAVAEEQKVGSRGWHLTFPTSKLAQWCIKLFVAGSLTALFAVGMVHFWCALGTGFWPWSQEFGADLFLTGSMNGSSFLPMTISQFIGLSLALYVSSRAPDSFHAFLVVAGIGSALALCLTMANPFYAGVEILDAMLGQVDPAPLQSNLLAQLIYSLAGLLGLASIREVASVAGILLGTLTLLILFSSFWSYRTLDQSARSCWSGAIKMFVPALMALWLVSALFGGIEEWKLWEEAQPRIQQMAKEALEKAGHKP